MGIPSGFPILPVLGGSRCAKRPDLPRLRPETMGPGPQTGELAHNDPRNFFYVPELAGENECPTT